MYEYIDARDDARRCERVTIKTAAHDDAWEKKDTFSFTIR